MPLHALVDSIQTLASLIERTRELRGRRDLPAGAIEGVDRRTDETLQKVSDLLREVMEAHARGNLTAMVRKEEKGLLNK